DSDQVSIVIFDGRLKVLTEATGDRPTLERALKAMEKGIGSGENSRQLTDRFISEGKNCAMMLTADPSIRLECAQMAARVFTAQAQLRSQQTLAALRVLLASVEGEEGRKTVVLFSDGFPLQQGPLAAQVLAAFFGSGARLEGGSSESV